MICFGFGQGDEIYFFYLLNYNSILFYFFLGGLSWSIVLLYYGKVDLENFRERVKSVVLFFPFWLGISIFLGSIGSSTYTSGWLIFHIFLYIWVGAGILYAINMILGVIKPKIHISNKVQNNSENQIEKKVNKSNFIRLWNFFKKIEFKILVLIIVAIGLYLFLSNVMEFRAFNHITSFYLLFTFLIIISLININYIIFKKNE